MIIRRSMLFVQLIELGLILTINTTTRATLTTTKSTIIPPNHKNIGHTPQNNERRHREPTLSECAARGGECDERRGRPVCGTDDRTYPSRCHLWRVQCSGHQVSIKYKGPCRACKDTRAYALKHKTKSSPKFIPRCNADGTYAPVQCLLHTGCWCSDVTGKPIEKTAVRRGKPRCHAYTRANLRRSPPRRLHGQQRACTQDDRALFNRNLIGVFQSEYLRHLNQQHVNANNTFLNYGNVHQLVLDWKFSQLDSNRNDTLDKNEFREVKKLVKQVIRPRRCGRVFGKFCDIDGDERLTRKEWNNCITKKHTFVETTSSSNGLYHEITQPTPTPIGSKHELNISVYHDNTDPAEEEEEEHVDYDNDSDYVESEDSNKLSTTHLMLTTPNIIVRPTPGRPPKDVDSETDCFTDQTAALEVQRNSGSHIYVPQCTPDGRYQRVQCYSNYCWCVNEDTGKFVPGTSIKENKPLCDSITDLMPRPMKGCPENRREEFLKELKDYFRKTLIYKTTTNGILSNATKWKSEDEQISTLSFLKLDQNKNRILERREWKMFRDLIKNLKTLRKCGRKLPRYCDVNDDKRVSLPEWTNCIHTETNNIAEILQKSIQRGGNGTNKPSKFSGFNPLEQYLRD